jgi:BMFP domain-containing protein YqiC
MGQGLWETLKNRAPQCIASLAEQSSEFQDKLVELIARKANLVSREEFERQKHICSKLQERISDLEQKIASFQSEKTQDRAI